MDFGMKIRLRCQKPIQRLAKTIDGELCTNWELIDSFGVRFDYDDSIDHTGGYENFYDDPPLSYWWRYTGEELSYNFHFCDNML